MDTYFVVGKFKSLKEIISYELGIDTLFLARYFVVL